MSSDPPVGDGRFDTVADFLSGEAGERPALVCQVRGEGSVGPLHHLVFDAGGVVAAWRPGESTASSPNLVLVRSAEVDRLDWAGGDLAEIYPETSVLGRDGRAYCLLGIDRAFGISVGEEFAETVRLSCRLTARCLDGRAFSATLDVADSSVRAVAGPRPGVDLTIDAPYRTLLGALHGELTLGNLIHGGAAVNGDIVCLSALDAVLSGERLRGSDPAVVTALRRWDQLRGQNRATFARLAAEA